MEWSGYVWAAAAAEAGFRLSCRRSRLPDCWIAVRTAWLFISLHLGSNNETREGMIPYVVDLKNAVEREDPGAGCRPVGLDRVYEHALLVDTIRDGEAEGAEF